MEEVTSDLVDAARKGKRDAVVELLAIHYPVVWRMASGLTGREDVGRGVVRYIMQRSLRALPSWKDAGAPTRWFHHHTLLTTRRTLKHPPDASNDVLLAIGFGSSPDPPYVAFIRALRILPMQQKEAFILSHGERLGARAIAVAMDCSVIAAENHLREAGERLRALAADRFDHHVATMAEVYKRLGPDEAMSIRDIRQRVRRFVLPWFIRRIIRFIFSLLILIIALWGAWWVWRIVQHSIR